MSTHTSTYKNHRLHIKKRKKKKKERLSIYLTIIWSTLEIQAHWYTDNDCRDKMNI